MIKLFGELKPGDRFTKEGFLMEKTEPKKGGGCGCRVEANAIIVEANPTPLRLYGDLEEVETDLV